MGCNLINNLPDLGKWPLETSHHLVGFLSLLLDEVLGLLEGGDPLSETQV